MRRPELAPPLTIIRPPTRWPKWELGELWRFRSICLVLVKRSIMVRYRQTVVGASWALIQPILLMLVFTVFFGILSNVPSEGVPYPVFVSSGLLIWQVVAKILSEGSTSVVANTALLNKIYFPRAYFPIAVAIASLVDLVFSLIALVLLLVWFGIVPGLTVILAPIFAAIAMSAVLGVSLWLSALNVAYRDVAQLLPFLTQIWMFVSPVIYPSSIVPEPFRPLYWINPLALAIDGFRWVFAGTPPPSATEWVIGTGVAAILLVSGYALFRHREPTFSDVV